MEKEVAMEISNIEFGYKPNEKVILDVGFKVERGDVIALIGSNGAGKSTLLKLILGLEKTISGNITVDGMELNKKNISKIRNIVGYIFQEADHQLFMPSIYEDIAFKSRQEGKSDKEIEDIVNRVLKEIGGEHLKDKSSHSISGGEKRLATIGVALASQPKIILFDEPTVGLDPKSRRQFINLISKRKETMIIATHDMDMVLDLCDRVIVLNDGSIVAQNKPMEIFNNKKLLEENGLEPPLSFQACPICNRNN